MTANSDHPDRARSHHRLDPARRLIASVCIFGTFAAIASAQPDAEPQPETPTNPASGAPEAQSGEGGQPDVSEISRRLRDPEAAQPALAAIASAERLPLALWRDVSILTTGDRPPELRALATEAVARFGTRESVKLLIELAADADPAVQQAAVTALPRVTGLGDGWTSERWAQWGQDAQGWNDRTWNRLLLTAQAERRRELDRSTQQLRDEVIALHRRLHVELDASGRSALISELIRDQRDWLRSLGFELAGRDLSARTALGPEVARAAAERLAHPDAVTRARAANLISRLVPPDAMLLLTDALIQENDPRAAEPMLLGVARWPNAQAVAPTLRWLERDDAPVDAAAMAMWALVGSGHLSDPDQRAQALAAIRALPPERIGEPGMRVLVRLGTPEDLDRIVGFVSDPEAPFREAAAEALSESRPGTERLIELGSDDPRLFAYASRGIARHLRTAEGMRLLAGLPALSRDDHDRAIVSMAERIPREELARAVSSAELEDRLAVRVLSRLVEPGADMTARVGEGVVLLARARLRLGESDLARDALLTLESIELPEQLAVAARKTKLWLLLSGEERQLAAEVPAATASDWIDAFDQLPSDSPAKQFAAGVILERFGDQLGENDRARVAPFAEPPTIAPEDEPAEAAPESTEAADGSEPEEDASETAPPEAEPGTPTETPPG